MRFKTEKQVRDYINGYEEDFDVEEYHRNHLAMLKKCADIYITRPANASNLLHTMEHWLEVNKEYSYMQEYLDLKKVVTNFKNNIDKRI